MQNPKQRTSAYCGTHLHFHLITFMLRNNYLLWKSGSPQELHAGGPQGDDAGGKTFSLHQGRRSCEFLWFDQTAGDACWGSTGTRGYNHPEAIVSAATHRPASCVYHKTHQKPVSQQSTNEQIGLLSMPLKNINQLMLLSVWSNKVAFIHWPSVDGASHWANIVWCFCGRTTGDKRVLIIFLRQRKRSMLQRHRTTCIIYTVIKKPNISVQVGLNHSVYAWTFSASVHPFFDSWLLLYEDVKKSKQLLTWTFPRKMHFYSCKCIFQKLKVSQLVIANYCLTPKVTKCHFYL